MHDMRKRYLVVFLSIIVSFVTVEMYFRKFNSQLTYARALAFSFPCFTEGQFRWVKLKPNTTCLLQSLADEFPPLTIKTNTMGLRNPEIGEKIPHKKRILFVGDSLVMGWGVSEETAFPRRTESILNNQNIQVETINAGFAASALSGYYLFLKLYLDTIKPDIIVIGFTMENDLLSRLDVEWEKVDENGLPIQIRSKSTFVDSTGRLRRTTLPEGYRLPILRELHTYIYLANKVAAIISPPQKPKNTRFLTFDLCVYKANCTDLEFAYKDITKLFNGIKKLANDRGITLLVAALPSELQVYDTAWSKYNVPFPLLPQDRVYPSKRLQQLLEKEGIAYIDLLPDFEANANTQLFFTIDDHWNRNGHEVAAEAISKRLKTMIQHEASASSASL
jgi:lysophospholipase L1-like esterase